MTSPEWIRRFTDTESADIIARELAAHPAPPASGGALSGVTFAAKDNIDVAGIPSSAAFPARAEQPAAASATAVRRLIQAGAIPAGRWRSRGP